MLTMSAPDISLYAEAVAHLHSLGISHRDIKPENLVFDQEGPDARIKVAGHACAQPVPWAFRWHFSACVKLSSLLHDTSGLRLTLRRPSLSSSNPFCSYGTATPLPMPPSSPSIIGLSMPNCCSSPGLRVGSELQQAQPQPQPTFHNPIPGMRVGIGTHHTLQGSCCTGAGLQPGQKRAPAAGLGG